MIQQENIHRYLNGRMTPEERQLFEQEMAADKKLAEAVDLQRDMAHFFKTHEPELEQQLGDLGDQYFGQHKKVASLKFWGWLIPILLIALLAIKWLCTSSEPALEETPPPKEIATEPVQLEPADDQGPAVTPDPPPAEPSTPVQEETKNDAPAPEKPVVQDRPIASIDETAFNVNPVMESLLSERVRHSTVTRIISPSPDTVFKSQTAIPFLLKGQTSAKPPFELLIYSNRMSDFDNDRPVLKKVLTGAKDNNAHRFQFKANLTLNDGLYYWMLRSENSGELLHVSKFRKKKN